MGISSSHHTGYLSSARSNERSSSGSFWPQICYLLVAEYSEYCSCWLPRINCPPGNTLAFDSSKRRVLAQSDTKVLPIPSSNCLALYVLV